MTYLPLGAKYSVYIKYTLTKLSVTTPSLKSIMSINIVVPSSDFNDNTVTFTSGSPGQIKLVGPGTIVDTGESTEGASGLCPAIFWWSERFRVSPDIPRVPLIYIVQFPPTTWQPDEAVIIDGKASPS